MALNYGIEPLWFRFGIVPQAPFGGAGCGAGCYGGVPNAHEAYSNNLAGGTATRPLRCSRSRPGTEARVHSAVPHGTSRGTTLTFHGHVWQRDPYVCPGEARNDLPGACTMGDGNVGVAGDRRQPLWLCPGGAGEHHAVLALHLPLPESGRSEQRRGRLPVPRRRFVRQRERPVGSPEGRPDGAAVSEAQFGRSRGAAILHPSFFPPRIPFAGGVGRARGVADVSSRRAWSPRSRRQSHRSRSRPARPRARRAASCARGWWSSSAPRPLAGSGALMEDAFADVRFRITDEATGKPVQRLAPGAWMDMGENIARPRRRRAEVLQGQDRAVPEGRRRHPADDRPQQLLRRGDEPRRRRCRSSIRPCRWSGRTSTLAQIQLPAPGMDWARSSDGKRLYVAMPTVGKVAVDRDRHLQARRRRARRRRRRRAS